MDEEVAKSMLVGLFNIHKYFLQKKTHIKKYLKLRKTHTEILESMENYLLKEYDSHKYFEEMANYITKRNEHITLKLNTNDEQDQTIIQDLFFYKNASFIPSINEQYIQLKRFKNKEKVKMLNAMNSSFTGLFKIIDIESLEGYVTIEDAFTKKRFKIIDISLSMQNKEKPFYFYNRIITCDEISFAAGINCPISYQNKELKKFLKKHNYKSYPTFYRTFRLYNISKSENKIKLNINNL